MREYLDAFSNILTGQDNDASLNKVRAAGFDPEFIGIYRNNSACALGEALAANYPSVHALVGEDYFDSLALEHMREFPCQERSVVRYSEQFLHTIKHNEPDHGLAYMADFCRLDHAWTHAFLAKDETPLALSTLTEMGTRGDNLENIKLKLMPSVQIINLAWPIFGIWQKIQNNEKWVKKIRLKEKPQYVLIWRYDVEVQERQLSPLEYHFLNAIKNGETLGAAMNMAIVNSEERIVEADLAKLLPDAVGANIFREF